MPNVVVQPVTTRRQRREFLQLPWKLYRNDPNWVPPLRGYQKEMVGYRPHPFYIRNTIQTFLAYRDGEACGRVAAILNQGHILRYNDPRGFFGFFECVDDQEVADALFSAVRRWFAEQGIFRLRGPTNPSLNYELGLLIDGFDSPPTFMMTYNPPYYAKLIENHGFRKTQDLYAFWGHVDMLPRIGAKLNPIAEQIIERYNVKLRTLDTSRFQEEVELFLSLYNRSLVNTWGFVPMTPEEVRHMARGLRRIIIPEMAIAAEIDGRVVGASFGLPDYNPRIKRINGRLLPFGFLRLLWNQRAIKRIRLISTNVLPEYQRLGIGLVLLYGLLPKALEWKLEEAEFSWVLESNQLSYGALKKGGAIITKTYRLYDLDEDEKASARLFETPATTVGSLEVREVRDRRDLDYFLKLPWRIYASDPHWVPPLLSEVKQFLDPRSHPFYKHGGATKFIALREGEPVGRLLVSDDPRYNQSWNSNVGCFGMFECLNDPPAAHALLDAAAAWLRARGRTGILGPIDYSTNYPCGLLIEGFHTPPRIMMNHNRPYYAALLESWGLRKAKDLNAWWFDDPYNLTERWKRRVERLEARGRIVIRPFRVEDFEAEVERCRRIYNEAMHDHWGFVSLTQAEFHYFARRLEKLATPDLVLLAEVDSRPVGLSITLPDINEALRPLNGRLTTYGLPLGLLRLIYQKRVIKTLRMVVLDVLEEYRLRGVAEMLIFHTLRYAKNVLHCSAGELSWTLEDNLAVNRTIEAVGGKRYKTYRVYEKEI